MIGDPLHFIKFKPKSSSKVTFGDDLKTKTIGVADIGKVSKILVHNVLLQFFFLIFLIF